MHPVSINPVNSDFDIADIGGLLSQSTKTKAQVDKIVPELQNIRNFVNLSNTMHGLGHPENYSCSIQSW